MARAASCPIPNNVEILATQSGNARKFDIQAFAPKKGTFCGDVVTFSFFLLSFDGTWLIVASRTFFKPNGPR